MIMDMNFFSPTENIFENKFALAKDYNSPVCLCLWVASVITVSRNKECLKKLPWVPPEMLFITSEHHFVNL